MEIRAIRFKANGTEVDYSKDEGRTTHVATCASKDWPSPEFKEAAQDLIPEVAKVLEFQRGYMKSAEFVSLSSSRRGYVVSFKRSVDASSRPFTFSTPLMIENEEGETGISSGFLKKILRLRDHFGVRFVEGFERETADLFDPEKGVAESQEEEAPEEAVEPAGVEA